MLTRITKWFLIFASVAAVAFIAFYQPSQEVAEEAPQIKTIKTVAVATTKIPSRAPARHQDRKPIIRREPAQTVRGISRRPETYEIDADPSVELGKNYKLVRNLAVIPVNAFDPSKGELIHKDQHFAFFKPAEGAEGLPVAYDRVTDSFHPLSHILHLQMVTAEVRQALLDQGLKEFYFNSRLKFLSIEASPTTVLSVYHQLKSLGYEVQMEVLKDVVQSK